MNKKERICPNCGSKNISFETVTGFCSLNMWIDFKCKNCGYKWEEGSKVDKIKIK